MCVEKWTQMCAREKCDPTLQLNSTLKYANFFIKFMRWCARALVALQNIILLIYNNTNTFIRGHFANKKANAIAAIIK